MALMRWRVNSFTVGISIAFAGVIGILIYLLTREEEKIELCKENESELEDEENCGENFGQLIGLLDSNDDNAKLNALKRLGNLTAFKQFQVLVREYGGLAKISLLIKSTSQDIKEQALNVINNLAMNVDNQAILKIMKQAAMELLRNLLLKKFFPIPMNSLIPDLVELLCFEQHSSTAVILAATRVLTNLTTLDQNHQLLVPHLPLLLEIMHASELPIKLQVLKIFVNISTNTEMVRTHVDLDIQIVRALSNLIGLTVEEELLLRCITCLANIFIAVEVKRQSNVEYQCLTKLVPENMLHRLRDLLQHQNEDVVMHARRALTALQLD